MKLEKIVTITGINKVYPSRAIGNPDHHPSTTIDEAPEDRKQGGHTPGHQQAQAHDDTATTQQPEEHSDTKTAAESETHVLDITA